MIYRYGCVLCILATCGVALRLAESVGSSLRSVAVRAHTNYKAEAAFSSTLSDVVNSHDFRTLYWQRQPSVFSIGCAQGSPSLFGMKQLEETLEIEFFDAGRGCFNYGSSGWMMTTVSEPSGNSFEDARLKFKDVLAALRDPNGEISIVLLAL